MSKLLAFLVAGLLAGGALAQASSAGSPAAPGMDSGGVASPSRPSSPSTPSTTLSTGMGAPAATGLRSDREIGGSGSAGLGAMGGGAMSSGSIFNGSGGSTSVLGSGRSSTPAPTMHDTARDHCPPGQVMRDQGCVRARTY